MVRRGAKIECGISPDFMMQERIFATELDGHVNENEEPYGNIMCMMFHGCIATAGLMGSILDRLATSPELQDKIYSEIIKIKQGSAEDGQSFDKMVLLLATIYESARLSPAGSLLQRCSLTDVLVVPVHLLQMDKNSWGSDANKFNPYRFLSEVRKVSDSVKDTSFTGDAVDPAPSSFILNHPNDNATFLPFGSGVRSCVGQKFVIQGITTLFASLLEHYKVMLKPEPQSKTPDIVFVRRTI